MSDVVSDRTWIKVEVDNLYEWMRRITLSERSRTRAFRAVNGCLLRRAARFLNRKSQRRYRLKFADTYYGELNHYGMYWLKWANVRRAG